MSHAKNQTAVNGVSTNSSVLRNTSYSGRELAELFEQMAQKRRKTNKESKFIECVYDNTWSPELQTYNALFDVYGPERALAPLELRRPHRDGFYALIRKENRPEWIAEIQGFFCGLSTIGLDGGTIYQATWEALPGDTSQVIRTDQNEWGVIPVSLSIISWLANAIQRYVKDTDESQPIQKIVRNSERDLMNRLQSRIPLQNFHPRTFWLTRVFTKLGQDWKSVLAYAANYNDWKDEAQESTRKPNLAAYWLWSHWLLKNLTELESLLHDSSHFESPVVEETREIIQKLMKRRLVRLGELTEEDLFGAQEEIARLAPPLLLAPSQKTAGTKSAIGGSVKTSNTNIASQLWHDLENDTQSKKALGLLQMLETKHQTDESFFLEQDTIIDQLSTLVDSRFVPLLTSKIAAASAYEDEDPNATPGLLLALARSSNTFHTFESSIKNISTNNFGPRRMAELANAYACFNDSRATNWLAERARLFVHAIIKDPWQQEESDDAFRALCERNVAVTHELLTTLLEEVKLEGLGYTIAIFALDCVDVMRPRQCAKGVERLFNELQDPKAARVWAHLEPAEAKKKLSKYLEQACKKDNEKLKIAALSGLLICAPNLVREDVQQILDEIQNLKTLQQREIDIVGPLLLGMAEDPRHTSKHIAIPWMTHTFKPPAQEKDAVESIQEVAKQASGN